ncbi:MAG: type II secretion system GspH family protein [Phycisphaerae bacterium]|nr:type II secretion system GspH family protein [Phycisphaerae bacterium]
MLKNRKAKSGFTLLELIIVLGIMGFLIAMVAPRLAGMVGGAVDTVCDTNQNRLRGFINTAVNTTNRLPNRLVSIVEVASHTDNGPGVADTWGAVTTVATMTSDEDPANGAETLAAEFAARNHFGIHYLSADEAKELRGLGLTKALILDVAGEAYREVDVKIGMPVLLIGGGTADSAAAIASTVAATDEYGAPSTIYRTVFGISQDASLAKDGVIENAPNCPGGIQNADNCTFNWYTVIMPRLAATVDRLALQPIVLTVTGVETGQVKTVYLAGDGVDNGNFATDAEGEEIHHFSTQCPEGHKWPEPEEDNWTITSVDSSAP